MPDVCPICKGSGKRFVTAVHHQSGIKKPAVEWCWCMKSRFVSESPYMKLIKHLGDEYMPVDQIDKQLDIDFGKLGSNPNLIIRGNTFDSFCLHIKSVAMEHRFADPPPLFYACEGIDLLVDFYVKQSDGSSPKLSDVDRFDLLIFTLGTDQKNDQLKTVVAQVVNARKKIKRPTWIFLGRPTLEACTMEYSPDLVELVKDYETITLTEKIRKGSKATITKTKSAAANFSR